MDLLRENVKQTYFRYLSAALAVVVPVWNLIYSLALLTGIGGSVLLSTAKGRENNRNGNEYFSAALTRSLLLAAFCWFMVVFSLDMGIMEAGFTTAIGALITCLALLSHFFISKNMLRFCRVEGCLFG